MKPQMIIFIASALFGVLQTFLLRRLMLAVTSGEKKQVLKLTFIKFLCYGVGIALLVVKLLKYVMYCLCGFIAGMPISAFIMFIYLAYFKGRKDKKYRR